MPGPPTPYGHIDSPAAGSTVVAGGVTVQGWALLDGPARARVVVGDRIVEGRRSTRVRHDVAALHPQVANAESAAFEADLDLRNNGGEHLTVRLEIADRDGAWVEVDRVGMQVEEPGTRRRRAAFTIVQNEPWFLPLWLSHYRSTFVAEDLYVLDHDSTDGSTSTVTVADQANVIPVHRDRSFDHEWLRRTVEHFQRFLLQSYEVVVFAEVDELIVTDPGKGRDLGTYLDSLPTASARCTGFNVVQQPDEAPIDRTAPLLEQRRAWHRCTDYDKRLISSVPLQWEHGFHEELTLSQSDPDPELVLIHLHRIDYDYCKERHRLAAERRWNQFDLDEGLGAQNRVFEDEAFARWFSSGEDLGSGPDAIPTRFRAVL